MSEDWPSPRDDPSSEVSHPWAHSDRTVHRFDWEAERALQRKEGRTWVESEEEREERERSILS
jgi:hypothetical protein